MLNDNMKLLSISSLPWASLETKKGKFEIRFRINDDNVEMFLLTKKDVVLGEISFGGEIKFFFHCYLCDSELHQLEFEIKSWIQCQLQIAYSRAFKPNIAMETLCEVLDNYKITK